MLIQVNKILNSDRGIDRASGQLLFNCIKDVHPSTLELSFEGMSKLSTLFLNESIGAYVLKYSKDLGNWFPKVSPDTILSHKIENVIENAQMGEEFDRINAEAQFA